MMEEKKDKSKLIVWGIMFILVMYVLCHISAQVAEVGYIEGMGTFYNHIAEHPFDILHFDVYVMGFGLVAFFVSFIFSMCKVEAIKGDMKGREHGDSHFQTKDEIKKFLAEKSTPVLKIDDYKELEINIS